MSDVIQLNVGGEVFHATLSTLTSYPDSMLGAMFTSDLPIGTDDQGRVFIDRDGRMFRHVLNFVRMGRLVLPDGFDELDFLSAEADFYQITPLMDAVKLLIEKKKSIAEASAKNDGYMVDVRLLYQGAIFTTTETVVRRMFSGRGFVADYDSDRVREYTLHKKEDRFLLEQFLYTHGRRLSEKTSDFKYTPDDRFMNDDQLEDRPRDLWYIEGSVIRALKPGV